MTVDLDLVYRALRETSISAKSHGLVREVENLAAQSLSDLVMAVMLENARTPEEAASLFKERASKLMVMIAVSIEIMKSLANGEDNEVMQMLLKRIGGA